VDARGQEDISPATMVRSANLYKRLKPLLTMPPCRLTLAEAERVQAGIRTLTKPNGQLYSQNVRAHTWTRYSSIARKVMETGLCQPFRPPKAPTFAMEMAKEPLLILTQEEKDAFLAAFKRLAPHLSPMIVVMFATGIRIGEALGLNVGDWNGHMRVLTVSRSFTAGKMGPTKTRKPRSFKVRKVLSSLAE
jgi:integrase